MYLEEAGVVRKGILGEIILKQDLAVEVKSKAGPASAGRVQQPHRTSSSRK